MKRVYATILAEEREKRQKLRASREKEIEKRNRQEAEREPVASRPAPAWLIARNRG
jgi:hypothetical protein